MKTTIPIMAYIVIAFFVHLNSEAQVIVSTTGNENLACIEVKNALTSANALGWFKDNSTNYSEGCNTLSTPEPTGFEFSMTPNPLTKGNLIIYIPSTASLSVYTLDGKVLVKDRALKKGKNSIPLSSLSSNFYLVKVTNNENSIVKKLLIK